MRRFLAGALVVVVALLAGCGGGDESAAPDTTATETTAPATTASSGECADVEAPATREDGGATQPTERLNPEKTWTLRFETSCGPFVVTLDTGSAPATAASLVSLAKQGFYDETVFHRIVPGFVVQGGDPTGTGSGGPGYSTRDSVPRSATYTKGVVAMAKTETEPPGTAGSQFFVVTAGDAGLPPQYALLGRVAKGQDVVDAIGELGDPASGGAGVPLQPVVIEKATVRRR
jgi:peptidyl-prolyl cis-trans isomerase B (cyclophilin B)